MEDFTTSTVEKIAHADTRAARFAAALDLMELGFELKRQSLKRALYDKSDLFIDEKLQEWIEAQ